jgi:predicted GNAT family acetyltransferase
MPGRVSSLRGLYIGYTIGTSNKKKEGNRLEILFDKNRFYAGDNKARPLAQITFTKPNDGLIVVDHTFTDPSLRGQGIARKLVEKVADHARQEGLKVGATCSYALKVLQEEQFNDIFQA